MIKFNFTKGTSTTAFNLIEALEFKLPPLANKYGVISTFCKIDEETYSAVSTLMSFLSDGCCESVSSVCNALLSGDWVVASIREEEEQYKDLHWEEVEEMERDQAEHDYLSAEY